MSTDYKRVTMSVNRKQHEFISRMSKPNNITQEELIGLMIDVLSANPTAIEPHIQRFKRRKQIEQQRKKDMEKKASSLIASLTDEQQEKLLSGQLDLSKLL